ncbi:MAG TPA: SusC/RagA family TonB-linked outer membrane protein [Gemmatimonadales bacterium]|nr:SusC/RagA family TonB-linked outer membrane protein [Gemmatimonadales bacterium]
MTRAIAVTGLLALGVGGTAWSQGQQVSGTVTSATTGEKLWGVTVRVKGTQTQTATDRQGRYALVAAPDAMLSYALIGYRATERPVSGQGTVDVTMDQAPTVLQEIVVTGYTTQRRQDITGAVSSVNLEDANRATTTSVLQRMEGQVAGVTVNNSGSPGSRSTVRIRGVGSFHNNDPLYIIDGTPVEDSYLNFLNPNDIAEIQVLKDASAASIYGSRASNGVIIIETRRGRPGGKAATVDVRTGVSSPVKGYDDFVMTDPLQYFEVIRRAYHNAGQNLPPEVIALWGHGADTATKVTVPKYTYIGPGVTVIDTDKVGRPDSINLAAYSYPNALIMPGSQGTDWWKAVFGTGQYTDANLALTGGGLDNAYNVSFNYLRQDGTAAYNRLQRGTVRVNTSFNSSSKLTLGENIAVSREQAYGGLDDFSLGEGNIVGKNILMQPVVPIYDIGGHFASGKATGLGNNTNPLKIAWAGRFDRNTVDRALGNAFAKFAVRPELSLRSQFSFNLFQQEQTVFNPTTFENSEANATNSITQTDNRITGWTWTNTLTYGRAFGPHNLAVLVGQEANSSTGRLLYGGISGLVNDDPSDRYINDALGVASTKVDSSSGSFDRLLSFFGKADYNYGEKYYASVTVRRDGSSKFAPGNRWGTFPAFNIGWRASRESFFPQGGFFSNVLLRFGYGTTGNEQIPGGRIVSQFGGGSGDTFYDIGNTGTSIVTGYRQTKLGNANLKWETNKSTNVGADLDFLQGRGNFTVDVYSRTTDNLLFPPATPSTAGAAAPAIQNVGSIRNRGIDFSASYNGTIGTDKVWSVAFNGSHYSNVILRIDGQLNQFVDAAIGPQITRIGNPIINEVGEPIGTFFGKVANGYFPDSATAKAHQPDATGACATPPCQPGAVVGGLRYVDINNDGKIDASDRTIIGSPHPDFTAGLNLGFRTGRWDFSATLFGSFGGQIYDAQKDFYVFRDFSTNVVNDRLTNSFCIKGDAGCTNPGDQNAKYPRLNQNDQQSDQISSFFIESATYVRLRALQIGFAVPATLISWLPSGGRIYVQAENLFTLTGYSGLDPSLPARAFTGASGDVRDQFRNVDVGVYPSSRTFTVGISTTF